MSDVAAYVIPLQCCIGRGGARKAVCAARGGGLVGMIGCRGLIILHHQYNYHHHQWAPIRRRYGIMQRGGTLLAMLNLFFNIIRNDNLSVSNVPVRRLGSNGHDEQRI